MQKFTAILEKNVEWFALGLAGLFFLFTIYTFIVQKPVTSSVGSTLVTPGEVDPKIKDGPARQLETAMANQSVPKMVVNDFLQEVALNLAGKKTDIFALPGAAGPRNDQLVTPAPVTPAPNGVPGNGVAPPEANQVVSLPVPPAPTNLQFSQGRSNVVVPPPGGVAAAGGNPAQLAGAASDRNWVTISGVIPMQKLADEWKRTNIPPQPNTTTILRVQLIREELDPQAGWINQKTIAPLLNVNLQPLPAEPPGPAVGQTYQTYAEGDQTNLLQPPFYTVSQGDTWLLPGQLPADQVQQANAPFDPAKVTDISKLTPEQKKIYNDYRKAEDDRKKQERLEKYRASHPQAPTGGGGGGYRGGPPPAGGGGDYAAIDPDRPLTLAQAYPPRGQYLPPQPGGEYPGMPVAPVGVDAGQPTQPGQPGPPPPIGPVPNPGSFDPVALAAGQVPGAPPAQPPQPGVAALNPGDVTIWAHDDTVQPGHTYHYKLQYIIRNPVYLTQNLCKPQKLAEQWSILSTPSAWTDNVSVKSETNFFATSTAPGGTGKVTFEIFRWKNGIWQVQKTDATPGDMVGTAQGQGAQEVNFSTGLTLVDVRPDPRNSSNYIILLTGDNGLLIRHDLNADRSSDEYKKLKDLIANANKPVASAAPAP